MPLPLPAVAHCHWGPSSHPHLSSRALHGALKPYRRLEVDSLATHSSPFAHDFTHDHGFSFPSLSLVSSRKCYRRGRSTTGEPNVGGRIARKEKCFVI
ncbi:hypothetical protein U9M48_043123 [Paspalum notatum var. saurae]|uniref:Uncharacterized protein n=1 Tax=Paspalum notatum var. saurae TaxID=547442 RepID=A0AAQ3XG49_PASNO